MEYIFESMVLQNDENLDNIQKAPRILISMHRFCGKTTVQLAFFNKFHIRSDYSHQR